MCPGSADRHIEKEFDEFEMGYPQGGFHGLGKLPVGLHDAAHNGMNRIGDRDVGGGIVTQQKRCQAHLSRRRLLRQPPSLDVHEMQEVTQHPVAHGFAKSAGGEVPVLPEADDHGTALDTGLDLFFTRSGKHDRCCARFPGIHPHMIALGQARH